MEEREKIRQLFERYREGLCTPEEQARLHAWLNQYVGCDARGLEEVLAAFEARETVARKRRFKWLPYAAALAIALTMVWYFLSDPRVDLPVEHLAAQSDDIAAGGNRAKLTLADGRQIDLSEAQTGIIVGDGITYLDGSAVLGEQVSMATSEPVGGTEQNHKFKSSQVHTLTTPNGGTYQITLPDGTKVWLNAASALRYPSYFNDDERVVFLEGEAYFDVTKGGNRKDKSMGTRAWPFRVISHGQEIEVLGTAFNISAYGDEAETKTTLVEGSVRLRIGASGKYVSLAPGEQSVLLGATVTKRPVVTDPYTAWKEGNFHFDNTPLSDMMKQMSRWYDVDVVYENGVPEERFSGAMSRSVSLRTVLELLRISEINYRIKGHQLIIE